MLCIFFDHCSVFLMISDFNDITVLYSDNSEYSRNVQFLPLQQQFISFLFCHLLMLRMKSLSLAGLKVLLFLAKISRLTLPTARCFPLIQARGICVGT